MILNQSVTSAGGLGQYELGVLLLMLTLQKIIELPLHLRYKRHLLIEVKKVDDMECLG